jgi:hypothetical protein
MFPAKLRLIAFHARNKECAFMRKHAILFTFILMSAANLNAQKNIIKLDMHAPIFRTGLLTYEHVLNDNSSFLLGLLYSDRTSELTNADYLTRFALTPEFRYYLQNYPAPRGFFISTCFRYQWMQAERREDFGEYDQFGNWIPLSSVYTVRELNTFGVGFAAGIQEVFKERISVELLIGPQWNSGDKRRALGDPNASNPHDDFKPYVGYFIRTGVNVGIAF